MSAVTILWLWTALHKDNSFIYSRIWANFKQVNRAVCSSNILTIFSSSFLSQKDSRNSLSAPMISRRRGIFSSLFSWYLTSSLFLTFLCAMIYGGRERVRKECQALLKHQTQTSADLSCNWAMWGWLPSFNSHTRKLVKSNFLIICHFPMKSLKFR